VDAVVTLGAGTGIALAATVVDGGCSGAALGLLQAQRASEAVMPRQRRFMSLTPDNLL
jgi:hypothetical protein